MMNEQDRRIKRTHHLLMQALLDLSATKPYEAISIRDITERADVGYATFFRHYRTKEALLLEVLGGVIDDLINLIQPMTTQGKLDQAGSQLFAYVAEHRALVRMLLAAQGAAEVQAHMWDTAEQRILATGTFPAEGAFPPALIARHLMAASAALIQWWLEHDMSYSIEQMGRIFATLIVEPVLATASAPPRG
jgi:AcrR family transcriptional regulator